MEILFLKFDLKNMNLHFKRMLKKIQNTDKKITLGVLITAVLLTLVVLVPMPTFAEITNMDYLAKIGQASSDKDVSEGDFASKIKNQLPKNKDNDVFYKKYITFTAYNSEVAQCDSSPCITANGFNVCEHGIEDTIAMNGIRMGTKIRIPELFGDRVFTVRDRMNSRYDSNRGDIWMVDKQEAREFGVKITRVEILK